MPTPSVGRIVHYVSRGSADGMYKPECRAAIITEVDAALVSDEPVANPEDLPSFPVLSLCVLNPEGLYFNTYVEHDDDAARGGTWHWPERVEENV